MVVIDNVYYDINDILNNLKNHQIDEGLFKPQMFFCVSYVYFQWFTILKNIKNQENTALIYLIFSFFLFRFFLIYSKNSAFK
jgi:hypothetical protein